MHRMQSDRARPGPPRRDDRTLAPVPFVTMTREAAAFKLSIIIKPFMLGSRRELNGFIIITCGGPVGMLIALDPSAHVALAGPADHH